MQRGQVDVLGGNKLVSAFGAQVFNVVYEEGIVERLLDEEDDLCTARRECFDDFSANSGRTTLFRVSAAVLRLQSKDIEAHRDHDHFRVHVPLRPVDRAIEVPF